MVGLLIPVSSSNSLIVAIHEDSPSSTFPHSVCNFPFIGALYLSLIQIPFLLYIIIRTYIASLQYRLSLASTSMLLILDRQSACSIFFPGLYSMSKLYSVSFSIHRYLLPVGFSWFIKVLNTA